MYPGLQAKQTEETEQLRHEKGHFVELDCKIDIFWSQIVVRLFIIVITVAVGQDAE